jgi:AcrR family transcriptional regulator
VFGGGEAQLARVRLSREARERLIVDGAIRFFAEVGFGGQTRELARQLGMSQSLLFKYFPTKSDLIDRVYEEVYLSRWNPYWEVLLENKQIPLRQRLLKFYSEYARRIMDYYWIRIFLYAGLLGSEINKNYLDLLRARIIYKICQAVRNEAGVPKLSDDELSERDLQLVWALQGSILYLAIQRHVYRNLSDDGIDAIIEDRVDAFLKGALSVVERAAEASAAQETSA